MNETAIGIIPVGGREHDSSGYDACGHGRGSGVALEDAVDIRSQGKGRRPRSADSGTGAHRSTEAWDENQTGMRHWISRELCNTAVQIMGCGVALIGGTNFMALAWALVWGVEVADLYPMRVTMAMPTAWALTMCGTSLVLLTLRVKPRTKTKWFRQENGSGK